MTEFTPVTVEIRFADILYILLNPWTVDTIDAVEIYLYSLAKLVITCEKNAALDPVTFDTVEKSCVDDT